MIFDLFPSHDSDSLSRRIPRAELAQMVMLTLLAATIRWAGIHRSLWLDELATSWVVRDSLADIFPRSILNNLSPLYYILVWVSDGIFGYNEVGLRFPSFAAGVLLVPGVYLVAYGLTGSRMAAFLAGWVAALDPTAIYYSLEARPYALIQLFALVHFVLFLDYIRQRSLKSALLVAMSAAVLFYLHYTSAILIMVDGLLLIMSWVRGPAPTRKELRSLAVAGALFTIVVMPAIARIVYLLSNKGVLVVQSPPAFADTFSRFFMSSYVIGITILCLFANFILNRKPDPTHNSASLDPTSTLGLSLWAFLPPLIVYLLDRAGLVNITLDRYLIASSVAAILLVSLILRVVSSGRAGQVAAGLMALLMLLSPVSFVRNVNKEQFGGRDRRSLVARVNQVAPSDLPVYVVCGLVESAFLARSDTPLLREYLMCNVNAAYRLKPDLLAHAQPVQSVESLASQAKGSFLYIGPYNDLTELKRIAGGLDESDQRSGSVKVLFPDQTPSATTMASVAALVEFE